MCAVFVLTISRCLLAKSPALYVVRVRSIPCVACLYAERFFVLNCILTCLECSPFRMLSYVSFVTWVLCTILLVCSLECLASSPIGCLCAIFSVSRLFINWSLMCVCSPFRFMICEPSVLYVVLDAVLPMCYLVGRFSWVICVPSVQCFASLPTKLCCMCGIRPKNSLWAEFFHGLCCNCSCFVCVLITL